MKYLIVAKPTNTPMPEGQEYELFKAAQDYGNAKLKDGTFDCAYAFFNGGGFAIANVASHEEAYDLITSYPMYFFFEWEVKPILDWDKTFENILNRFKK